MAEEDSVLLLRGDFLYDQRIIQNMVGALASSWKPTLPRAPDLSLPMSQKNLPIAWRQFSLQGAMESIPDGLRRESPETLVNPYRKELLKFDMPLSLADHRKNRRSLEKRLFSGSYKGVTDLVTKWLWPTPARWATRNLCPSRHLAQPGDEPEPCPVGSGRIAFLQGLLCDRSGLRLAHDFPRHSGR